MSKARLSGNITRNEVARFARDTPGYAYIVMCALAEELGLPHGKVTNNNQPGSDHVVTFPENTTIDVGIKVAVLDWDFTTQQHAKEE